MALGLIVAMDHGRLIGRAGDLPWRIPADLKRFKQITMGTPIIMGRRTHVSIGCPLPGRKNIVVTRNPSFQSEGCLIAHSLPEALSAAGEDAFVIGGASLYGEALATADIVHLTVVHTELDGDTYFPPFDLTCWRIKRAEHFDQDESSDYAHSYYELFRAPQGHQVTADWVELSALLEV